MLMISSVRRVRASPMLVMISARSVGESDWRRRLPFLAFLARISTGTVSGSAFVKKEPTFCPRMIFRMVLYFIPLQMTTPQPLSNAHSEDFTFDSIPPVPVNDFSPNLVDGDLLAIASNDVKLQCDGRTR